MTRHELARLREAYEDIRSPILRHNLRGQNTIRDLIADAKAEHEAEDRAHTMEPVQWQ